MDLQKCFRRLPPLLTGGRGLQGRVPLTLPLPPAVAGADALEQVPPIILLAPGISDSVRCPGVLIVASVCVRKKALKYVNQVDLAHAQLKLKNTYSSLKLGMLFFYDVSISCGATRVKLPKGCICSSR